MSHDYRREYLSSLGWYSNDDFVKVLVDCLDIQESRIRSAGLENRGLFQSEKFFETSAAALRVGSTLKSVLKSTKALGDTSVLAGRKGSQAAVTAAMAASKATGNVVGASSKVIVKVSSDGAKAIVKVVSSSAERVRSRSVGRRRTSSSEDVNPADEENDTDRVRESRMNSRPSLLRILSSQECNEVEELGSGLRRSRSRSRLRRSLSASGDANDGIKETRTRSTKIVQRRRQSKELRRSLSCDDVCDDTPKGEMLHKGSASRLFKRCPSLEGSGTDDESSEELNTGEHLAVAVS
jgi:hypothetical protein